MIGPILAMGLGTWALRLSFLGLGVRLPELIRRGLRFVPAAVLAALVAPALAAPEGVLDPAQPRLWAGMLAAAVAARTHSVVGTLVVGMVALHLVGAVLH